MPWSAKAQDLLRTQYAAVGSAGSAALPCVLAALQQAAGRLDGPEHEKLVSMEGDYRQRAENVERFITAYRHYCWPVSSLADLKLAPFHLLATEGHVHTDKDHLWHMETLSEICRTDAEFLQETSYRVVDVTDPASQSAGIAWWEELTGSGGEGMVVKPLAFIHRGGRGLASPPSSAGGANTCESSTDLITRPRPTWHDCGLVGWGESGRWPWPSSRWVSKGWNDSSAASHCGAFTNVFSACLRSKANPSTRGYEDPAALDWLTLLTIPACIPLACKARVMLARDIGLIRPHFVAGHNEHQVMLQSLFVIRLLGGDVPMTVTHRHAVDSDP